MSFPLSVLEQMEDSCDRQLHLINILVETQQLEMSGLSLQSQPLNLGILAQQLMTAWEPLLLEKQASLENQILGDLPEINGDRYQLWRVFENLIANALKHNPPGLKIRLSAEPVETISPSQIKVTVADNGLGMSLEQANNLFELYYRGDGAKGTLGLGLGLYLCRQIINAHGGEIGVVSSPNAGTQFWFTLSVS